MVCNNTVQSQTIKQYTYHQTHVQTQHHNILQQIPAHDEQRIHTTTMKMLPYAASICTCLLPISTQWVPHKMPHCQPHHQHHHIPGIKRHHSKHEHVGKQNIDSIQDTQHSTQWCPQANACHQSCCWIPQHGALGCRGGIPPHMQGAAMRLEQCCTLCCGVGGMWMQGC